MTVTILENNALNRYDLEIKQGATFTRTILWEDAAGYPFDMTGWTAKLQIRAGYSSISPLLTLTSSPAAGIVITPLIGQIDITITAAQSATIQQDRAVYDIEIDKGGGVRSRLVEGKVMIYREVTR
jgi:hypothetical protein